MRECSGQGLHLMLLFYCLVWLPYTLSQGPSTFPGFSLLLIPTDYSHCNSYISLSLQHPPGNYCFILSYRSYHTQRLIKHVSKLPPTSELHASDSAAYFSSLLGFAIACNQVCALGKEGKRGADRGFCRKPCLFLLFEVFSSIYLLTWGLAAGAEHLCALTCFACALNQT